MLMIGSEASARNEQLQWTHGNPSTVNGFRVYWRTSGSSTLNQVDAGLPAASGSTYSFTVASVPDTSDVYFSVRAFNAGGDSPPSNEICRGPGVPCGTTSPPPPTDPPPTGGAQSAIDSFKLWSGATTLDADFRDSDVITASCAAIEIIGNPYLSSGAGSILKQLGNQSICENSPPYGWKDGSTPGQFACMDALANQQHTLMVTPFDGENCSGTMGTSVDVTFTVNVGGTTPPPTEPTPTLGMPGKPYLVQ